VLRNPIQILRNFGVCTKNDAAECSWTARAQISACDPLGFQRSKLTFEKLFGAKWDEHQSSCEL
jgi:hypothetical protein